MVPVLIKMYKLIINELSNQLESNMSTQAAADDEDVRIFAKKTKNKTTQFSFISICLTKKKISNLLKSMVISVIFMLLVVGNLANAQ